MAAAAESVSLLKLRLYQYRISYYMHDAISNWVRSASQNILIGENVIMRRHDDHVIFGTSAA